MPTLKQPLSLMDIPLFKGLSRQELKEIEPYIMEQQFKKGESLFYEGKSCEKIFIVRSGQVKIYKTTPSGKEQTVEILGPGDSCACHPGAVEWSCSTAAEAVSDSGVWFLKRNYYSRLMDSNAKLAKSLNQIFANRFCRFCALIENVSVENPTQKLVKFLLDMETTYNTDPKKNGSYVIPLSHEEIASRIGVVRETVTRHLHDLKVRKWIDIKPRQVIILDRKSLQGKLS